MFSNLNSNGVEFFPINLKAPFGLLVLLVHGQRMSKEKD